MAHIRELEHLTPDSPVALAWETLVQQNPASGFMQSLTWATARRRQGLKTLHLGLFDDGHLIGGAICYAASERAGLLVAPEGPVLPWENSQLALHGLRLIQQAAERVAPAYGALGLRIEPRLEPPRPRALKAYRRAPFDLVPPETLYLDLMDSPAELLAAMRPKGRYNIRLAARRGVTIRQEDTAAAVPRFYTLLREAGRRDDFFVEPLPFFVALAETLCPLGMARFLFAEHEGDPLGVLLLLTYGPRATYLYGGVSNRKRHLMAGYALQWAAIELARQAGCTTYDFYGYEPHGAPDHLYAGFSRFKRQFGGHPLRFIGAHDFFFLDRLADAVVRTVHELTEEV